MRLLVIALILCVSSSPHSPPSLPRSTSSSATAASSTAPALPGTPATSASATGASPRSAGSTAPRRSRPWMRAGQVVAPGFIDMLGQSELAILVNPSLPSKIFQGITTEITGEGGSPAPLNDAIVAADRAGYEQLRHRRPTGARSPSITPGSSGRASGSTSATYVGATQVRRMVLGDDDRIRRRDSSSRCGRWSARRCARGRRPLDLAPVPARPLRRDAGADRAGERGGEARRRLRDASAERER